MGGDALHDFRKMCRISCGPTVLGKSTNHAPLLQALSKSPDGYHGPGTATAGGCGLVATACQYEGKWMEMSGNSGMYIEDVL